MADHNRNGGFDGYLTIGDPVSFIRGNERIEGEVWNIQFLDHEKLVTVDSGQLNQRLTLYESEIMLDDRTERFDHIASQTNRTVVQN